MRKACIPALVAAGAMLGALASTHSLAEPPTLVARILGEEVRCDTRHAQAVLTCAAYLLRRARFDAEQAFVARHRLTASADEIAALQTYNRDFEQHDRAQRTRKLAQIEMRLLGPIADAAERDRLLEFRAVLLRLARYEADVEAGVEPADTIPVDTLRNWIEGAKLNAALHRHYGGTVGLNAAGAYAHGAKAALVAEYLTEGRMELLDARVDQHFRAALSAPPSIVYPGIEPDFTPFWKRSIPATSYMAD